MDCPIVVIVEVSRSEIDYMSHTIKHYDQPWNLQHKYKSQTVQHHDKPWKLQNKYMSYAIIIICWGTIQQCQHETWKEKSDVLFHDKLPLYIRLGLSVLLSNSCKSYTSPELLGNWKMFYAYQQIIWLLSISIISLISLSFPFMVSFYIRSKFQRLYGGMKTFKIKSGRITTLNSSLPKRSLLIFSNFVPPIWLSTGHSGCLISFHKFLSVILLIQRKLQVEYFLKKRKKNIGKLCALCNKIFICYVTNVWKWWMPS